MSNTFRAYLKESNIFKADLDFKIYFDDSRLENGDIIIDMIRKVVEKFKNQFKREDGNTAVFGSIIPQAHGKEPDTGKTYVKCKAKADVKGLLRLIDQYAGMGKELELRLDSDAINTTYATNFMIRYNGAKLHPSEFKSQFQKIDNNQFR